MDHLKSFLLSRSFSIEVENIFYIIIISMLSYITFFITGTLLVDFVPDLHVDDVKNILLNHKSKFMV
jgi:hypothetical protein